MKHNYQAKRNEIDQCLDACGIGFDVEGRLDATMKRLATLSADVCAASATQAMHDAFVNRPHGIQNSSVGKDDAERAFVSGVVSVLGALVEWNIMQARQIAADILEDVNDHKRAAEIRAWDD